MRFPKTSASYAPRGVEAALRRAKFSGGAAAEKKYRDMTVGLKVAGKQPKSRSEKSRSAWRNDPGRDEKIFLFVSGSLRKGQPVRLTKTAAHTVWAARKNLADAARSGVRLVPEVGLPHWDHASDRLKTLGWSLASKEWHAVPFSLRLSPEVATAAIEDKRGVARYLQDRIARHLRQRLPDQEPMFWFAVEQGIWEEPHLHGAVVIPEGGRDHVISALKAAGGAWKSAARQCQLSAAHNLVTWMGYATKWLHRSRWRIRSGGETTVPERLLAASQPMRRAAKRAYQEGRSNQSVLYPDRAP